jgi:hypothetical protein
LASTTSQIKAGLKDVADRIVAERNRLLQAKSGITTAKTTLANMGTQYSTLMADIAALSGTDPFTLLVKDERAKLIAEFQALQTVATNAETAVASIITG